MRRRRDGSGCGARRSPVALRDPRTRCGSSTSVRIRSGSGRLTAEPRVVRRDGALELVESLYAHEQIVPPP